MGRVLPGSVEKSRVSCGARSGSGGWATSDQGALALDYEDLLRLDRIARLDEVLSRRTRTLTLLLEDVFDPHNAAACLRSAEAFGIQDVHVVPAAAGFEPSRRVVQGADKWLHVHRHPDTPTALRVLRGSGYRIWVSDLGGPAPARAIDELDFGERVALAFGNEHDGVSRALVEGADGTFVIPMRGFTQSLNVSVAVALALYHAVSWRAARFGPPGDLSETERSALRREWLRRSVKQGARIEAALQRGGVRRAAPRDRPAGEE